MTNKKLIFNGLFLIIVVYSSLSTHADQESWLPIETVQKNQLNQAKEAVQIIQQETENKFVKHIKDHKIAYLVGGVVVTGVLVVGYFCVGAIFGSVGPDLSTMNYSPPLVTETDNLTKFDNSSDISKKLAYLDGLGDTSKTVADSRH